MKAVILIKMQYQVFCLDRQPSIRPVDPKIWDRLLTIPIGQAGSVFKKTLRVKFHAYQTTG